MEPKVIKPFHMFDHQGRQYIINIEGMFSSAVDDRTAAGLERIADKPSRPFDFETEEQLKKLGLLEEGSEKNTVKKAAAKEYIPVVNLALFLTQSCNLRCVYCYGDGGGYGSGGDMEEETAFQAVDWLVKQSGKIKKLHIGFFGGEPFLKFALMKKIVAYAQKKCGDQDKQVEFHATTNGTLLHDEQIAFIKEHKMEVLVSLDGPQEIHDAQRPFASGQGSYKTIVPKVKKLITAVPDTSGHAVIFGNTDPRLVKDALKEIGFASATIMPAAKSLFNEPGNNKAAREAKIIEALEEEAKAWLRLAQNRDSQELKQLKNKSGLYQGIQALLHNSKRRYACGAGLGMAAVSIVGDIYLCHRFVGQEDYKIGSVFEKELRREKYLISPVTGTSTCANCFAKYYCAGGCKHDNAGSGGTFNTPPEDICRLRRRELELAAMIVSSLEQEDKAFLVEREIFEPKPCPLDF